MNQKQEARSHKLPAHLFLLPLLLAVSVARAQQVESFDAGTYSDIFQTNPAAVFSFVSGQGLGGTRGLQPLNTQYNINHLRKSSLDLSYAGASIEISAFFKVVKPTSTNLGVDTLQLGFARNQTATSFISSGQAGTISWELDPKATLDTGAGFYFRTSIHVDVYNGSSSAGFGWGTIASPVLKSNNWYKATLQIQRVNSSTLSIWAWIDDYGATGQTYLGQVDITGTSTATGNATYPFTPFTSDSSLYPALRGMTSGGLKVVDQVSLAGMFSPALATDIYSVVQLDFATQNGRSYYIYVSTDLLQWTAIEGPIAGTGNVITRYFPASGVKRFFRITQETP